MPGTIARRYVYEGRVQGVGFRRKTEELSSGFRVTGYVMNKADGRVEVHVEGDVEEVNHFAEDIAKTFEGNITRVTQELVDPCLFQRFGVSFEKVRMIVL